MVYDATDAVLNRVHCRLAWSREPLSGWSWADNTTGAGGLTGPELIPLGLAGPAGTSANAFDSHLCFAAKPVRTPEGERLYYMGSNGKHSGSKPHRNASLGLALLRTDGFAGLLGTGFVETVALAITHPRITLTADIVGPGGFVRVGVRRANSSSAYFPGVGLNDCESTTTNVTDAVVSFSSGATLAPFTGQDAVFVVEVHLASAFTIGSTE